MDQRLKDGLRALKAREQGPGTRVVDAPLRMALLYPSPYHVAMSSLGYLQIHRLANARAGTVCERAMLPDPQDLDRYQRTRSPLVTLESFRPVRDFDLIGLSHAYELELTGIVQLFDLAGLSPLAKNRSARDPLVVIGGPITFSNPLPTAPFADVMILGEAEGAIDTLLSLLEESPQAARGSAEARRRLLEGLADRPGFFVPSLHGEWLPPIAQAPEAMLPAYSEIRTPNTELKNMMLIEPERGCHRGCTFCVMRRTTNGGMRLVSPKTVTGLVSEDVHKVGLVGAAVTDHPGIKQILGELIDDRGLKIGVSSLRADRLDDEFVGLLARGGYRSMTVALDAASARLRDVIEKNIKDRHVERAAALAKNHGMRHLKLYVIVGLPGETDEDREELAQLVLHLKKTLPLVLGVSPFVPKFHTPLADAPFLGEKEVDTVLKTMRRRLAPAGIQLRGPGAREAYVEYRLSQGGFAHAEAAMAAARAGGKLSHYKRSLRDLPERIRPSNFPDLVPAPTRRRQHPLSMAALGA